MKFAVRRDHLARALDDWQARGLLASDVADRLRADLGSANSGSAELAAASETNFARFALMAGAVCLGLGAISFVAANWDVMARGVRLILVLGVLWLAWGGAGLAAWRGWSTRFEALAMLATLLFGAAMALVSQIFQIQGEIDALLFLWAAGALTGALLARARGALAVAVLLIAAWDISGFDRGGLDAQDALVLGGLAVAACGAWAWRAGFAGRLVLVGLFVWAIGVLLRLDVSPAAVVLGMTLLPGAGAVLLWSWAGPRHLHGVEAEALGEALAVLWIGLLALFLLAAEWDYGLGEARGLLPAALPGMALATVALWLGRDGPVRYDLWVALVVVVLTGLVTALPAGPWPRAALILAVPVWAVRMGGRHGLTGLRRLGMLGFGAALLMIYLQTVGSLLGTAGFYAGAGALLIAAAWGWRRWGRG